MVKDSAWSTRTLRAYVSSGKNALSNAGLSDTFKNHAFSSVVKLSVPVAFRIASSRFSFAPVHEKMLKALSISS